MANSADPFGVSSGGRGSDPFGVGSKGGSSGKKAGGALGFVENLGGDVKDATLGFVPGVVHSFEHPVRAAKQVGAVYKDTYGKGWSHFLHTFYAHPLGPLMDLGTVVTAPFGIGEGFAGSRVAGALDKAGVIDGKAGSLVKASEKLRDYKRPYELRGARAILADGGKLKGVDSVISGSSGHILDRIGDEFHGTLPRRAASMFLHDLLKKAPAETPLIGEIARYGRAEKILLKRGPRALGMKIGEFQAAIKNLKTDEEKISAHLHMTGTSPESYANFLKGLHEERGPSEVRDRMVEYLSQPEMQKAFDSYADNPRLQHAVESGRAMANELTKYRLDRAERAAKETADELNTKFDRKVAVLGEPDLPAGLEAAELTKRTRAHQEKVADVEAQRAAALKKNEDDLALTKQLYAERPWLHARLERGARFMQTYHAPALERSTGRIAAAQAKLDELHEREAAWLKSMKESVPAGKPLPTNPLAKQIADASTKLEHLTTRHGTLEKGLATRFAGGDVEKLRAMANQSRRTRRELIDTPESSVEALRKEFADAGRPEPVYVPDIGVEDQAKGATVSLNAKGGTGAAPFANDRFLKQNQGILYMSGKIALDPMALGVAFKDFARRQYLEAIHDELIGTAVANQSGVLPKGWVWIKENARERLPRTSRDLAEARGKAGETSKQYIEAMIDRNPTSKTTHLMVPEGLVSTLTDQFTRSDRFIRRLWEKPTTVWRAIILNLRVGWLVNNVIGQHMLLWFHYAGPDMLQAWGSYIRERFGAKSAESRSFDDLKREYTSQEVYGTQFRSQSPGLDPLDDSQTLTSRVGQGFTALTNKAGEINAKVSEDLPRSIAMRTHVIREARRMGDKIHTDAERFNKLAEKVLSHPHLADRAMKEADRALGDYTTLGDFEKKVVRQLVPFYSWFRAITKIVLNAAIDTPGRVAVAVRLGEIGEQWVADSLNNGKPLPDYLEGLVPLFGHVVNTKSASPYGSVDDVVKALTAFVHGNPGKAVGSAITPDLSPFIQAGMEALTGKTAIGQDAEPLPKHFPGGLAGTMAWRNFEELPAARALIAGLGKGRKSKTFGSDSLQRELLSYLGVPWRPKPHISG